MPESTRTQSFDYPSKKYVNEGAHFVLNKPTRQLSGFRVQYDQDKRKWNKSSDVALTYGRWPFDASVGTSFFFSFLFSVHSTQFSPFKKYALKGSFQIKWHSTNGWRYFVTTFMHAAVLTPLYAETTKRQCFDAMVAEKLNFELRKRQHLKKKKEVSFGSSDELSYGCAAPYHGLNPNANCFAQAASSALGQTERSFSLYQVA